MIYNHCNHGNDKTSFSGGKLTDLYNMKSPRVAVSYTFIMRSFPSNQIPHSLLTVRVDES